MKNEFTTAIDRAITEPDGNYIDTYGRRPAYIIVFDMKGGDRWLFEGKNEGTAMGNAVDWIDNNGSSIDDVRTYYGWSDDYIEGEYFGRENRKEPWEE